MSASFNASSLSSSGQEAFVEMPSPSAEKPAIQLSPAVIKEKAEDEVAQKILSTMPEPPPLPTQSPLMDRVSKDPTNLPLARRLEIAVDQRNIARIAKGIAQVGQPTPYKMKNLEASLNPVAKLEDQFYVTKETFQKTSDQVFYKEVSWDKAKQLIQNAIHSRVAKADPKDKDQVFQASKTYAVEILKFYFKPMNYPLKKSDMNVLIKTLEDFAEELISGFGMKPNDPKITFINDVIENLKQLTKPPIDVNSLPTYFSKDEILSSLKLRLPNEECEKLIIEINQIKDSYISSVDAEKILTGQKSLLKNCNAFVFSLDVETQNSGHAAELLAKLKAESGGDHYAYAVKMGSENAHEGLAISLAGMIGLQTYLVPKKSQTFTNASFNDVTNPDVIASRWVQGESMPSDTWKEWLEVKRDLNRAIAAGQDTQAIKTKYDAVKEKIYKCCGAESVSQLLLLDMVFFSSDSHINQFKVGPDGQMHNFDFARCLAPTTTYSNKGLNFFTLRSDLLDHPLADEPLNDKSPFKNELSAIRDHVLSWDVDAIEKTWISSGLVGEESFFADISKQFETLETAAAIVTTALTRQDIEQVCEKLHLPIPTGDLDLNGLKKAVINLLYQKNEELKVASWSKMHPQTVSQWKARVLKLQEYYKTTPEPTLKGAWLAYHPETAPFLKAIEILDDNTGSALMVRKAPKGDEAKGLTKIRGQIAPRASVAKPQTIAKFKQAVRKAAVLTKGVSVGLKPMKEIYSPEQLLKQHFYGKQALALFEIWRGTTGYTDSFTTWVNKLEKGIDVPGSDKVSAQGLLKGSRVQYLNADQRKPLMCEFDADGRIRTPKEGLLQATTNPDAPFITVMDEHNQIYVERYNRGELNHSSFFAGQPVAFAGELHCDNGKLVKITDKSGHYGINDEALFVKFLRVLQSKGIDLAQVEFELIDNREKFSNAAEALKKFEKRLGVQRVTLRPLEMIISDAEKSGRVAPEIIEEMKTQLAAIQEKAPTYFQAKTGSPLG